MRASGTGNTPAETGFFSRNQAIPKIGYEPQLQQDAFNLTMKQPLMKKPVQGRQGWYVVRLQGRQAPDEKGFAKEKASIVQQLTEQKKQAAFNSWVEQLKANAEIEINKDLIKM